MSIEIMKAMANYIDALGGDSKKYRQAIAEAEKQEPVAHIVDRFQGQNSGSTTPEPMVIWFGPMRIGDSLYNHPQPKQEQGEPVAWMHKQGNHEEPSFRQLDDWEISNGWEQYPLYTTPQQRKPLTDAQIKNKVDAVMLLVEEYDAIEAGQRTSHNYNEIEKAVRELAAHGIKE
jgi:hypothetical protein